MSVKGVLLIGDFVSNINILFRLIQLRNFLFQEMLFWEIIFLNFLIKKNVLVILPTKKFLILRKHFWKIFSQIFNI